MGLNTFIANTSSSPVQSAIVNTPTVALATGSSVNIATTGNSVVTNELTHSSFFYNTKSQGFPAYPGIQIYTGNFILRSVIITQGTGCYGDYIVLYYGTVSPINLTPIQSIYITKEYTYNFNIGCPVGLVYLAVSAGSNITPRFTINYDPFVS